MTDFLLSELERALFIQIDIGFDLVDIPREQRLSSFFEREVFPLESFLFLERYLAAFQGLFELDDLLLLFILSNDLVRDHLGDLEGKETFTDSEQQEKPEVAIFLVLDSPTLAFLIPAEATTNRILDLLKSQSHSFLNFMSDRSVLDCILKHLVNDVLLDWHAGLLYVILELLDAYSIVDVIVHGAEQVFYNFDRNFQWSISL